MLSPNIDAGQLLITGMIAVIGYFIKRELDTITKRLDKHDSMLIRMISRMRLNGDEE